MPPVPMVAELWFMWLPEVALSDEGTHLKSIFSTQRDDGKAKHNDVIYFFPMCMTSLCYLKAVQIIQFEILP